jgi:hypothetical protein
MYCRREVQLLCQSEGDRHKSFKCRLFLETQKAPTVKG